MSITGIHPLQGRTAAQVEAAIAEALDPLTTLDLVEDFLSGTTTSAQLGALGWIWAGGSVGLQAGEADHPGIIRRDTSATINTVTYMALRGTAGTGVLLASEDFDLTWVFRLNTNDTDTRLRIGLSSDFSNGASPVSAVYLEKLAADTQWFGVCRAASTETRTAALATVETTSFHTIRMRRIDATTVGFTFDSGAEVTVATNVPGAVAVQPGNQLFNSAAAAKTLDLDLFRLKVTGIAR